MLLKSSLIQTSSGSVEAEGVFSILNKLFAGSKTSALEDHVEAGVMLQYNRKS